MTDNKKENIIIAVVAVILVVGIATIIGVNVKNKTDKQTQEVGEETTTTVQDWTEVTTTTAPAQEEVEEEQKQDMPEIQTEVVNENGTTKVKYYPNGKPSGNAPAPKPNKPQANKPAGGNSNGGGNKPNPKPDTPSPQPAPKPSPEPLTRPTKPGSRPLNDAEKQWIVDNYFMEFPKNGAAPNFTVKELHLDYNNGLDSKVVINNNNYKETFNSFKEVEKPGVPSLLQFEARNCEMVEYWFTEEGGQTVLYYEACTAY